MKLKCLLTMVLLAGVTISAQAAGGMDIKQLSKYAGVIYCVDKFFFDGGHTEGDKQREALMSEVLSKYGLPPYNEKIYQSTEDGSAKIDIKFYSEGSQNCNSDAEEIRKLGKKHGLSFQF